MRAVRSRIYRGTTVHARLAPVHHEFRYRIYWFGLDLDELDHLSGTVRGFGRNRFSLVGIRDEDYAGPGAGSIRQRIVNKVSSHGIDVKDDNIMLMTIPRIAGYVFNPVNFYICRGADDTLRAIVAEVRNTFGEMHHYIAAADAESEPHGIHMFRFKKRFYVSPFLSEDGEYLVQIQCTDDRFAASISLVQAGHTVFTASMDGHGKALTSGSLTMTLLRMPLAATVIMARIQWQAILLRLRRGVRPRPKPAPVDTGTIPASKRSIWYWIRNRLLRYAEGSAGCPQRKKSLRKDHRS
jgi:DUF1365 family protein